MKAFILGIVALFSVASANAQPTQYPILELKSKNTVILRGPVTLRSTEALLAKMIKMSNRLTDSDVIYLFLDTPGGSVIAGLKLISAIKAFPQKVHTVTIFAASMGFIIAQNLNHRLVLPDGILMSHRAFIGLRGQIPGEFTQRSKFWTTQVNDMNRVCSTRMNIKISRYEKLIRDEFWTYGARAVTSKTADSVVLAACGESLSGTYINNVRTFFGTARVTYSKCPLLSQPIRVDFSDMYSVLGTTENMLELEKLKAAIYDSLHNNINFVEDNVLQSIYFKYVK